MVLKVKFPFSITLDHSPPFHTLHMKNEIQVETMQGNFGLLSCSFQLAVPIQAYLEPCETDPSLLMCYLHGLATGGTLKYVHFMWEVILSWNFFFCTSHRWT